MSCVKGSIDWTRGVSVCRDLREMLTFPGGKPDERALKAHGHLAEALRLWFLCADRHEAKRHVTAAYGLLDQILSTGPSEAPQAASAESDSPPADSRPDGLVGPTYHDRRPTGLKEGY